MRVNFYLDQVSRIGKTKEEKELIKTQVQEYKRTGKPIPNELLNPKPTAIYIYVRIDDFTYKIKTGQRIEPKYWDVESQQVKRAYTGSPELNEYLNYLKNELQKNHRILTLDKESISTDDIKKLVDDLFVTKKPKDVSKEFFDTFEQFMEVKSSDKTKATIKKYNTLFNLLDKFQQTKKYQVSFETMNTKFYDLFKTFLIKDQHQTNNTIGKYISTLKTFLHWATDREYNSNLLFKKFKVPNENADIIYLTEEELFHIYNFKLDNKKLESVRDVFCFGCFTGARFSDVSKLTKDDIKQNAWHLRTTKTRDKLEIPLNEFALEILEKYTSQGRMLPTMSNQKINAYLKRLGKLLDINEHTTKTMYRGAEPVVLNKEKWEFISTHTARRTFVTLSLEKGMRPEVLMSITGHKDYKTMKKYLKIVSKVKEIEMNNVWKREV